MVTRSQYFKNQISGGFKTAGAFVGGVLGHHRDEGLSNLVAAGLDRIRQGEEFAQEEFSPVTRALLPPGVEEAAGYYAKKSDEFWNEEVNPYTGKPVDVELDKAVFGEEENPEPMPGESIVKESTPGGVFIGRSPTNDSAKGFSDNSPQGFMRQRKSDGSYRTIYLHGEKFTHEPATDRHVEMMIEDYQEVSRKFVNGQASKKHLASATKALDIALSQRENDLTEYNFSPRSKHHFRETMTEKIFKANEDVGLQGPNLPPGQKLGDKQIVDRILKEKGFSETQDFTPKQVQSEDLGARKKHFNSLSKKLINLADEYNGVPALVVEELANNHGLFDGVNKGDRNRAAFYVQEVMARVRELNKEVYDKEYQGQISQKLQTVAETHELLQEGLGGTVLHAERLKATDAKKYIQFATMEVGNLKRLYQGAVNLENRTEWNDALSVKLDTFLASPESRARAARAEFMHYIEAEEYDKAKKVYLEKFFTDEAAMYLDSIGFAPRKIAAQISFMRTNLKQGPQVWNTAMGNIATIADKKFDLLLSGVKAKQKQYARRLELQQDKDMQEEQAKLKDLDRHFESGKVPTYRAAIGKNLKGRAELQAAESVMDVPRDETDWDNAQNFIDREFQSAQGKEAATLKLQAAKMKWYLTNYRRMVGNNFHPSPRGMRHLGLAAIGEESSLFKNMSAEQVDQFMEFYDIMRNAQNGVPLKQYEKQLKGIGIKLGSEGSGIINTISSQQEIKDIDQGERVSTSGKGARPAMQRDVPGGRKRISQDQAKKFINDAIRKHAYRDGSGQYLLSPEGKLVYDEAVVQAELNQYQIVTDEGAQ